MISTEKFGKRLYGRSGLACVLSEFMAEDRGGNPPNQAVAGVASRRPAPLMVGLEKQDAK